MLAKQTTQPCRTPGKGSTQSRILKPACSQDAVLYRALQFAKTTDVRFIWIDQDCIDHGDPDDFERHQHLVHNIFCSLGGQVGYGQQTISPEGPVDLLLDHEDVGEDFLERMQLFVIYPDESHFLKQWQAGFELELQGWKTNT